MIDKEEIREEIQRLRKENTPCIVEGIKDMRALQNLGIENVITLSRKALFEIVEDVAEEHDEVAILTDIDEKGKQLYHRLYRDLQKKGVKIDNKLRKMLFKAKISHVEGLDTYLST